MKGLARQTKFVARPWGKVGADLCDFQGRTLLVVSDYYSNYIEVEKVSNVTTSGVTKALKAMYARYGVPDTLVTDNGPQFASAEFAMFAKTWGFEHITSSPRYPQSNGKAENAVKTVKRLFSKCKEAGQSEFLALLDWRNTPSEGVGTSPAQRFLGRRCKTLLPATGSLLAPRFPTREDARAINHQKQRQQHYYDRHVKPLKPIPAGEAVNMRLTGKSSWSAGVCKGLVGPRSYEVEVGGQLYARNRRHLIPTNKQVLPEIPDTEGTSSTLSDNSGRPQDSSPNTDNSGEPSCIREQTVSSPPVSVRLRRSERNRKPPEWITTYVPS